MLEGWGRGWTGGKWDPRGDRNVLYLFFFFRPVLYLDCDPGYTHVIKLHRTKYTLIHAHG